jgi:hypothetical protein
MYTRKKGGLFVWNSTHKRRMKEVDDINRNLTNENIHLLELIEEYKKLNRGAWRAFDKCDKKLRKYKREVRTLRPSKLSFMGNIDKLLKTLVDEKLSSDSSDSEEE